jgi:diguanylate cyclase (GGDEF)-like protein
MTDALSQISGSDLFPVFETLSDGVAILAPVSWRIVYLNPAFQDRLNRPNQTSYEVPLEELVAPAYREGLRQQLNGVLGPDERSSSPAFGLQLNVPGSEILSARCCRLVIGGTLFIGVVLAGLRIPSRTETFMDVRRDPLTQLPDREFLLSRLSSRLQGDRAADRKFAVLFVDLDNFKQINDAYGHLLGDRVLREVASRLSESIRQGDNVTRFGGDEFVVLLENIEAPEEIVPVVARVRDAFATPIVLAEGEFQLSLSIGVTKSAPHHRTAEDVLAEADREMYAAKRAAI